MLRNLFLGFIQAISANIIESISRANTRIQLVALNNFIKLTEARAKILRIRHMHHTHTS